MDWEEILSSGEGRVKEKKRKDFGGRERRGGRRGRRGRRGRSGCSGEGRGWNGRKGREGRKEFLDFGILGLWECMIGIEEIGECGWVEKRERKGNGE